MRHAAAGYYKDRRCLDAEMTPPGDSCYHEYAPTRRMIVSSKHGGIIDSERGQSPLAEPITTHPISRDYSDNNQKIIVLSMY